MGLIGIATWNFREGTLAERIDRFAGIGYNAISLNTIHALPLARGETPDVDEAIARRSLPVTIHGGLAPKGEPIDRKGIIEAFRRYLDWQKRTGLLRTINFDMPKRQTEEGRWEPRCEETRDTLAEMLSLSDGAGFTVGIEDWPMTPEHLEMVEDLRQYPHYGMLIDLGHLNMRIRHPDTTDYPFPVEAARGYLDRACLPLNELHIHNNNGKRDEHAPPEGGTADMLALAGMVRHRAAGSVSTIELVPAWCGLTEEEGWIAAREALDYWRRAMETPEDP